LARETEVLGEIRPQYSSVYYIFHITRLRLESGRSGGKLRMAAPYKIEPLKNIKNI
jgi:hypothetical protein